jgi:UDP-2,4-diacetamido-2,4,6-trideoxy-beta-L-altropyranose hydrolase
VSKTKPIVLIRCDAGAHHGLGHLVRCLTLAEALRERGHVPCFICHDPMGIAEDRIVSSNFQMIASPESANSPKDFEVVQRALGQDKGIVIFDSKDTIENSLSSLRKKGLVVAINDDVSRNMSVDVLINPNVWVSADNYPGHIDRQLLVGQAANLVRPEFFQNPARSPENSRLKVLITFGGEDPSNHTGMVVDLLKEYLQNAETTVILGPSHPEPDAVRRKVKDQLSFATCLTNPPDLVRHVCEADVAITAGGTTCYELAAAGIPMLGVAIEPHQKPMIEAMESAGCLLSLSDDQTLNRVTVISRGRELFLSSVARLKLSKAARNLFKEPGASYLAEQILQSFYLKCE